MSKCYFFITNITLQRVGIWNMAQTPRKIFLSQIQNPTCPQPEVCTKIWCENWKVFFRCASISWFEIVSQWLIHLFLKLAHLRVFQIILFSSSCIVTSLLPYPSTLTTNMVLVFVQLGSHSISSILSLSVWVYPEILDEETNQRKSEKEVHIFQACRLTGFPNKNQFILKSIFHWVYSNTNWLQG